MPCALMRCNRPFWGAIPAGLNAPRGDQFRDPGHRTADVVGQSGQAELSRTFSILRIRNPPWPIQCLIEPKGCSARLPAAVQHSGPVGEALCHAVEHRLIRVPSNAPGAVTRALHLQSAAPASPAIGVGHQRRVAHPADVQGLQLLPVRTGVSVGSRVVAEPLFRKATTATGRAAPWLRHIRRDPRRLAPGDVLDLEVSLVSHSIDPLDAEARARRAPSRPTARDRKPDYAPTARQSACASCPPRSARLCPTPTPVPLFIALASGPVSASGSSPLSCNALRCVSRCAWRSRSAVIFCARSRPRPGWGVQLR